MTVSNDIKNEIIECYKNKISQNEILDKFEISRATYYRIIKNFKNNNDSACLNTLSKADYTSDNYNNDLDNENYDDNDNDETYNDYSSFDEEEFKNELNDDDLEKNNNETFENNKEINEKNEIIEKNDNNQIFENKDLKDDNQIFIKSQRVPKKSKINKEELKSNYDNHSQISVKFNTKKNKKNNNLLDKINNNKSIVFDTLKNVNIGDLDEIKEKRPLIIKIRKYIKLYPEQLKHLYKNKQIFETNLLGLSIHQLNLILEDIRITINLDRNEDIFMTSTQLMLRGIESTCKYTGYDIDGMTDEIYNDPEFIMDLKMISAEIDMCQYINPKTSAFLKIIKKIYTKHKENEVKNQMDKVLNDNDKLEKIKNLDKK